MFKIISLLLALSICTTSIFSQDIEVKISPEYSLRKSTTFSNHLGSDETGHYVQFQKQTGLFTSTMSIAKYGNKFEELWNHEFLADKRDITTYGLKAVQDQFIWLLSDESKKKTLEYYLAPINKEGNLGTKIRLNTVKYEKRHERPYVDWTISEDTSKVMVVQTFDHDKQKIDFEYNVSVLDPNLEDIWSKHVKLRKSQEQVDVLSSVVGNDGIHYMLVKEYDDRNAKESKRKRGIKVAGYELKIYKLADNMDQPEVIRLDLKDKFAKGASLKIAENGDITCIGMFANLKNGNITGIYYLKMDSQGNAITSNQKGFSKEDLAYLGDKNVGKDRSGDQGLDGFFDFGEQLVLDDGTIVVSAEENFLRTFTNNQGQSRTVYYSNDIVVITFGPDGTILSIKLIPKRQSGATTAFLSHTAMSVDSKGAYFFYNDDIDNIDRPLDKRAKKISGMKDAVTACTHVDLDGNITRRMLQKSRDINALLLPSVCNRVNDNTLFFVGMKYKLLGKSNFRIGTIEIQ